MKVAIEIADVIIFLTDVRSNRIGAMTFEKAEK